MEVVDPDAAATAVDSGAANELRTLEKSEDTSVYDDSCSSSSEKGLKEVRLVTSSTILVLLRDLEEGALWAWFERESTEESMVVR